MSGIGASSSAFERNMCAKRCCNLQNLKLKSRNASADIIRVMEGADRKLVEVSPTCFEFTQELTKAQLKVSNALKKRVAWRIQCNAPASYIVSPSCGFLADQESVTVDIELAEVKKRRRRGHRFVLQAMEADRSDVDKRKVWLSDRAQELSNIHHIRLYSVFKPPGSPSPSPLPAEGAKSEDNSSQNLPTSSPSLQQLSTCVPPSDQSSGAKASTGGAMCAGSPFSAKKPPATAEERKLIDEISAKIQNAIAQKRELSGEMVGLINEIKRIEMELEKLQTNVKDWELKYQQKSTQLEDLRKKA